jgi:hypothetical protein
VGEAFASLFLKANMSSIDEKIIEVMASAVNIYQGYIDVTPFDRMNTEVDKDNAVLTMSFYDGAALAFTIKINDCFDSWTAELI